VNNLAGIVIGGDTVKTTRFKKLLIAVTLAFPSLCTEIVLFLQSLPPLPVEVDTSMVRESQLPMVLGLEIVTRGVTGEIGKLILNGDRNTVVGQVS
jgi:hypothetical protein